MPTRHEGSNITGRNLIKFRLEAGKSRDLFVRQCGDYGLTINESKLEDIEENNCLVYDYELVVFAKVLGISIDGFFSF